MMLLNTAESNALIVDRADESGGGEDSLANAIARAFAELARQWGTRAQEILDANKRGAKTSSAQWRWGMDRLHEAAAALVREGLPTEPVDKATALAKTEAIAAMLVENANMGGFVVELCDTPDVVEGADRKPDRCLLAASHLGDGSHHQGRYSRWPARADDQARRTRTPGVPSADIVAFIAGETDTLAALPDVSATLDGQYGDDVCVCPKDQAVYCHRTPCFGGADLCTCGPAHLGEGPAEDCPKHGRTPDDVTDIPAILTPDNDAPSIDSSNVRPFHLPEGNALARRPHRSVSQVELFNECGMKYRLRYRDGVRTGTAWFLVGGTAFHACAKAVADRIPTMADYERETASGWSPDLKQLWMTVFAQEIEKAEAESGPRSNWRTSKGEGYDWWFVGGEAMVRNYFAWHCSRLREGWEILRIGGSLATELEFLTNVGGVNVKGFIDEAWWHAALQLAEVIDFKTGNSTPGDTFQLGQYAWSLVGMSDLANRDNTTAGYYNPRKDVHTPTATPVLERHPWEEIVYQITTMDRAEKAGVYIANTQTNYGGCGSCEMRKACPIGARR